MGEVRLSASQTGALAAWIEPGPALVRVTLRDERPRFVESWEPGDLLAIQGDAHLHLAADGKVKAVVPPSLIPQD
jgi:hypothetical protein